MLLRYFAATLCNSFVDFGIYLILVLITVGYFFLLDLPMCHISKTKIYLSYHFIELYSCSQRVLLNK